MSIAVASSTTVGVFEAKTHFSELLTLVERGEEVTITKHGKTVAKLVPVKDGEASVVNERLAKWKAMLAATQGTSLEPGCTTKDLIEEGRNS